MTLRLLTYTTVLAVLTLVAWTCAEAGSATVDEPAIHGNFYVRYLADGNQLRGQATIFNADSTTLTPEGGVSFMGGGTRLKELPNGLTRYDAQQQTPFPEPTRFALRLPGRATPTEVKLPMTKIHDFSVDLADKTDGLRLTLNGTTLAEDESLLLFFTDPDQEARSIVRAGPLTRDRLVIPADAVTLFTPGEYRLYLVKSRQFQHEEAGWSYAASVEYYSSEIIFTLNE